MECGCGRWVHEQCMEEVVLDSNGAERSILYKPVTVLLPFIFTVRMYNAALNAMVMVFLLRMVPLK